MPETSDTSSERPRVIAVVGPTAMGKTLLAEELALFLGGEIVTADSMQVYRGMDIGTAKIPPAERRVPHHLLDVADPGTPFSAALYQDLARSTIDDLASRGRQPIVCGGTGLYVRAALDEMRFPAGERSSENRERIEALAERVGPVELHAHLARLDPESAALIHPNNIRRTIRALEMYEEGIPYASQAAGLSARRPYYPSTYLGLEMARERLYERIDARVDAMLEAGLLDEVRSLLAAGFREALTAQQAIGYKEFVPAIEDGAPIGEAVAAVKQATRRYAKRQLTWFRADPRVHWIDVTERALRDVVESALSFISSTSTAQGREA